PPGGAPPTRVIPSASTAGGPRAATAAGAAAATARERDRSGDGPQRSVGQLIGVGAVGLVVLLALLFAFGVIGGGDDGPGTSTDAGATPTTTRQQSTTTPRYDRTEMKTVVFNASGTALLAKDVSDRIEEEFRFPMGQAANYNTIPGGTDTQAVTTVQYRTGADQSVSQNRAAAQAVARFLKLRTTSTVVRRMTPIVSAGAAGQKVVVVVGADYARANPTAGAGQTGGASTDPASPPDTGTSGTTGGTGGTTGGATSTATTPSTGQLQTPTTGDLGTGGAVDGTGDTGGGAVP
ncbi:LytR C-terminal domain-containing protein, partial [Patulibacter sp.]|uniref:LytR C-terminal domain-containing protein n=1 Tax=Patulibacter sp. TaxID=1912859 RepID=UPI00271F5201